MPEARQGIIREGIVTGIIGATAVALWFLIVDTVAGHPLYTPHVLGAGVFGVLGPPAGESMATYVIAYTIFHYAVFILAGIVLAAILWGSESNPALLAGLAVFIVVFQVGFFAWNDITSVPSWNRMAKLRLSTGLVLPTPQTGLPSSLAPLNASQLPV